MIKYELINYDIYKKRLNDIVTDDRLINLNIRKNKLGYTKFGYELCEFVIGYGEYDLFIVGGTHGSEIIGVDFVTQLLKNVPDLPDYDPNLITLHIIPNQNPEGFDITTQTLKSINSFNMLKESKDYYFRYTVDNLLNDYLIKLNVMFKQCKTIITPKVFIDTIKLSFQDKTWKKLVDNDYNSFFVVCFKNIINNMPKCDSFRELFHDLNIKMDRLLLNSDFHPHWKVVFERLKRSLFSDELLHTIESTNTVIINENFGRRLYQEKFEKEGINGTKSKKLSKIVRDEFRKNNIPKGSQVKFDANGSFVNLNKNRIDNPGIMQMKNEKIKFGLSPANNILDNAISPIGKPTEDIDNFKYSYENIVLFRLLKISNDKDRLKGVLLYHGTGGVVFSKPYQNESNYELTNEFLKYNDMLSESYRYMTGYEQIEEVTNTGVGDFMRQKYPGVLLIELSKMIGNPIAPYGDLNNYYSTIHDNFYAVNNVIRSINDQRNKKRTR